MKKIISIITMIISGINAMSHESHFAFKTLQESDLSLISVWFKNPVIAQWWPTPNNNEDFFNQFLPRIRSSETNAYIISRNNRDIGYIQKYKLDEKARSWLPALPQNTIGIDQFIGEDDARGKGYGSLLITAFIQYMQHKDPTLTTVIVEPDPQNKIAIKCYERVGFTSLGIFHNTQADCDALVMLYTIK